MFDTRTEPDQPFIKHDIMMVGCMKEKDADTPYSYIHCTLYTSQTKYARLAISLVGEMSRMM